MNYIKYKHLLFPYLIVVFTLILFYLDQNFFNLSIKNYLPSMPENLVIYALLMGYPHIFASFFSLFDKEYYNEYKNKINYGFILIFLFTASTFLLDFQYIMLIFVITTSYHVVRQYIGINKILFKENLKYLELWTWLNIFLVFLFHSMSKYDGEVIDIVYLNLIAPTSIFIFILFGLYFLIKIKNINAKILFFINIFSLLVAAYFFYQGYIFFTILIPRFIHDVTAFIFYINHDSNRKEFSNSNIIYKFLKNNIYYISLFLITTSILLNVIFTFIEFILFFLLFITYFHYYIESFIWKNNTIHRKNLKLKI